jgi:hypothetical protein
VKFEGSGARMCLLRMIMECSGFREGSPVNVGVHVDATVRHRLNRAEQPRKRRQKEAVHECIDLNFICGEFEGSANRKA